MNETAAVKTKRGVATMPGARRPRQAACKALLTLPLGGLMYLFDLYGAAVLNR